MLKPTIINAFNIPEVWYRALWELFHREQNRDYMVQRGSFENQHKRRELDYLFAVIENPGFQPYQLIPEGCNVPVPTNEASVIDYFTHYIMGTELAEDEQYTYGQRINLSVYKVIEILRKAPNTNQAIIEIGQPSDIELPDPPCLRLIDCRVKDGQLHFVIYFRSWDLFAGLPENLGGLQLLKEYMAMEIGVQDGGMIIQSKGAHVYDYAWGHVAELVKARAYKEAPLNAG